MRMPRTLRKRGFLFLALCLTAPAWAQEEPPAEETSPTEVLDAEHAEVAALLAELEQDPSAPAWRAKLLSRLATTLQQHLNERRRMEELALQREAAEAALQEGVTKAHGDPPYSLALYDEADESSKRAEAELSQLDRAAETARGALAAARAELDSQERERRQAKEDESPELPRFTLRSRLAKAIVGLRETELANSRSALENQRMRVTHTRALYAGVAAHVVILPADVQAEVATLDGEEAALRRRLERAELDLEAAKTRWQSVQAQAQPGETAELALPRARLALRQKRVAILGEELDRLAATRELVHRRLAMLGPTPPPRNELRLWLEGILEAHTQLERDRSLDLAEVSLLEQELQELEKRSELEAAPGASDYLETLRDRIALHRGQLANLDRTLELQERLIGVLEERVGTLTFRDRVARWGERSRALWHYELFESGDQPITTGKVLIALSLVVVGLLLASRVTRIAGERVLPRFGFDAGASHAFASLGFYALLIVVVLLSLRTVNIPLTAFALLGGALAIGLGFGSQNVVNNFISGIILLAERPIKVGDLIQVEETYGNVERIGLRSTRIRTGSNIHIILPNSTLLENKVINWTHNDARVRIELRVGVIYGSPTREVETLILKALQEHTRVLPSPKPFILFADFGDNSLDFSAHFWVAVRSLMDRLMIESELRFRVDELFREAGIVIAFPQRDVHLDAAAPLEIRLVDNAGSADEDSRP